MGPQLFSCGDRSPKSGKAMRGSLQWGHNFSVVEIGNQPAFTGPLHTASMGPQLFSCGDFRFRIEYDGTEMASMGPQLFSCGDQHLQEQE